MEKNKKIKLHLLSLIESLAGAFATGLFLLAKAKVKRPKITPSFSHMVSLRELFPE